MDKNQSVDDILEEIKRKKAARAQGEEAPAKAPQSAQELFSSAKRPQQERPAPTEAIRGGKEEEPASKPRQRAPEELFSSAKRSQQEALAKGAAPEAVREIPRAERAAFQEVEPEPIENVEAYFSSVFRANGLLSKQTDEPKAAAQAETVPHTERSAVAVEEPPKAEERREHFAVKIDDSEFGELPPQQGTSRRSRFAVEEDPARPKIPHKKGEGEKPSHKLKLFRREDLEEEEEDPISRFDGMAGNRFQREDLGATQMSIPLSKGEAPREDDSLTRALPPMAGRSTPFQDQRQKKAAQFRLNAPLEEEPIQRADELDDYDSPEDAPSVAKDISSTKMRLWVQLVLLILLFGISTYFAFSKNLPLPLPEFMFPERDMQTFLGVNLGVMIAAAVVSCTTVGGGLINLFTLKADNDSAVALATVAAIGQGVALVIGFEHMATPGVHFYFPIVIAGLLFNILGKLFLISRVQKNFRVVSSDYEKHALLMVGDRNLSQEMTQGLDLEEPHVAYSAPAEFLTRFLDCSYSEDQSESISRISTPILAGFSLLASIVSYFISRDLYLTLTVFTATLCICAPFTSAIVGNLPLYRGARILSKSGAMIAGYEALDHFDDAGALALNVNELFEDGSMTLHGIKAFADQRIDEAIVDAASVIAACGGLLTDIFMQMIGGKEELLKPVDDLVYEDGMGLSAWVDGKRVLIGSRELMLNHEIQTPDRDYELKFRRDGREVLYISNSGELTAMFIVSYNPSPDVVDELAELIDRNISLIIHTTDPNVTSQKVSDLFSYPSDLIKILPAKLYGEFDQLTSPRKRARAEIAYTGSILSKLQVFKTVATLKRSVTTGTVIQLAGLVLGYALVIFFAFTGSMSLMGFESMLLFQMFFALAAIIVPSLKRL